MKYVLVGVYDKEIDVYLPPQCMQDMLDEDIIESNRRAVKLGKIDAKTASRSILVKYGHFDDEHGQILPLDHPVLLVDLADFLPKKEIKSDEVPQDRELA